MANNSTFQKVRTSLTSVSERDAPRARIDGRIRSPRHCEGNDFLERLDKDSGKIRLSGDGRKMGKVSTFDYAITHLAVEISQSASARTRLAVALTIAIVSNRS